MAVSLVQSKNNEVGGTTAVGDADGVVSITLDSTPTAGNILVAVAVARDEVVATPIPAYTDATISSGGNDWTLIEQQVTTPAGGGHRGGIWWRIAEASEATHVEFTVTDIGTMDMGVEVHEFSHDFTTPWVSGADSSFTSDTSSTTVSSGTTEASETQPVLWFGFGSIRNGTNVATMSISPSVNELGAWHGGVAAANPYGNRWICEAGWLEASATTAQNWTWTSSTSASRWAMLVGFVEKPTGAKATGGLVTESGGYVTHTFTESGSFVPDAATPKASDDFNRANESLSASANWTSIDAGSHSISSNVVVGTSAAGLDHTSIYDGTTFGNDQWAEVTASGLTDAGNDLGLVIRHSNSALDGYRASWTNTSGGSYEMEREDGGTDTALDTPITGVGTTGPRTLRLEAVGDTISFYVDGVLQLQATDTNYPGGYPGIFSDYETTSDSLDNFSAGDTFLPVEYLTVAGGGGGAGDAANVSGGSGGAGGMKSGTALTVSSAQTITVGGGGAGGAAGNNNGAQGTGSSIGSLVTTTGGGFGGIATDAGDGGSGGGGHGASVGGAGGTGTSGEGSDGGDGNAGGGSGTSRTSGGGGGKSAAGADGASGGGDGGDGAEWPSGSGTHYAGGAGGSVQISASGAPGSGGLGGGADGVRGSQSGVPGVDGTPNTGGGGSGGATGSAGSAAGGDGGSGIVVLRYVATTATVPGAPTALAGTAGNAQVVLTWTAPVDDGGATITDYVVEYRPA